MIALKRIDVAGQFGLILVSLLMVFIPGTRELAFYSYFIVGGWQLISTGVHQINRHHLLLSQGRKYYHLCLALLAGIGLACFIFHSIIYFYLFGLLLFSPAMAIWYLVFSMHELEVWKAKALVHLK